MEKCLVSKIKIRINGKEMNKQFSMQYSIKKFLCKFKINFFVNLNRSFSYAILNENFSEIINKSFRKFPINFFPILFDQKKNICIYALWRGILPRKIIVLKIFNFGKLEQRIMPEAVCDSRKSGVERNVLGRLLTLTHIYFLFPSCI